MDVSGALRRLRQPDVLTGALVGAFVLVVAARGPLTQALGTADDVVPGTATPSVAAPPFMTTPVPTVAPTLPSAVAPPATAAAPAAAAPRGVAHGHHGTDPFVARVRAAAAAAGVAIPATGHRAATHSVRVHPVAPAAPKPSSASTVKPQAAKPAAAAPAPAGCAASYLIKPGDSLWSIAQQQLHTTTIASTNRAWHRIYRLNERTIGSNPSLLEAGVQLCLPS